MKIWKTQNTGESSKKKKDHLECAWIELTMSLDSKYSHRSK